MPFHTKSEQAKNKKAAKKKKNTGVQRSKADRGGKKIGKRK